jgi:integrase/recombinase XerD
MILFTYESKRISGRFPVNTSNIVNTARQVRDKKDKTPARALSAAEVVTVLAAFKGPHQIRDKALFMFMCRTGFRISEALSLTVGDLYVNGKIVDCVYVTKQHMKGKQRGRHLPVHPEAKQFLELRAMELITRGAIARTKFFNMDRSTAWRAFDAAFADSGVPSPRGTHACRKTFAQNCYRRLQGDIYTLSKLLGHSSTVITEKYLSVDTEAATKAVLGVD